MHHFQTDMQRKYNCIYVIIILPFILTITHSSIPCFYIANDINSGKKMQNSLMSMCSICVKGQRREEGMEYAGKGLDYIIWTMTEVQDPISSQVLQKSFRFLQIFLEMTKGNC